eukprot:TRINITY_DN8522_c0_g1_i1.p1 TRINITY_DN8522_c0_g1~~TRINITY_DN8522_c0_g1_i1.p1  ORF type:complete len:196 (+),score=17.90 TRINITY_DN8522_c0_g1_i1:62-649(+)
MAHRYISTLLLLAYVTHATCAGYWSISDYADNTCKELGVQTVYQQGCIQQEGNSYFWNKCTSVGLMQASGCNEECSSCQTNFTIPVSQLDKCAELGNSYSKIQCLDSFPSVPKTYVIQSFSISQNCTSPNQWLINSDQCVPTTRDAVTVFSKMVCSGDEYKESVDCSDSTCTQCKGADTKRTGCFQGERVSCGSA